MDEEAIFTAALKKSLAQRSAFLDQACEGDAPLRSEIEGLLEAYEKAGRFLQQPPAGLAPTIATGQSHTIDEAAGDLSLEFLDPSDKPNCLGTLGPYEVVDVVGRGGMGLVLRAYDPKLNRVVAIKVMVPELAASPMAVRRFLREAQAAAAVSHRPCGDHLRHRRGEPSPVHCHGVRRRNLAPREDRS